MKRKVKTISIKSLAVFLSIVTILLSLPTNIFAFDFDTSDNSDKPNKGYLKDAYEVIELRDESVKHFKLEDGSYVAVQYDTAVHYLDGNGRWQDIDNTLSSNGSEYSTSNARIKFAKKITGNEALFTLHDGNKKITMSLDGAKKKTTGNVTNIDAEFDDAATKLQKMMTLNKLSSKILYADILDNVDLEYVVQSNNIKENIIIKSPVTRNSFTFEFSLNNLSAEMLEDGSVSIYDPESNEIIYCIPKGYMKDSSDEYSDKVYYNLEATGNGKYSLTVIADQDWMNSPDLVYPVTIDPPIYVPLGANVTDTYINSYSTTSTPYDLDYLYVGNTTQLYWKTSTLPTLPQSAYITNAEFALRFIDYGIEDCEAYMGIFQVQTDWDKYLTWSQYKSTTNPKGTYDFDSYTDFNVLKFVNGGTDHTWVTWNVTEIVNNWYNGQPNYGFSVSDIRGYSAKNLKFASNEYLTSYRPKLVISYKDMKGVEDYWTFTSQNVGLAGTGNVNNATGTLSFSIGTLKTVDSLMGYSPTLTYNQALAGGYNKYFTAEVPYSIAIAGFGFKFNMNETIVERTYSSDQNGTVTYYVFSDADGTEHYFVPYEDSNGNIVYKDEDGLHMTLTVASNSYTIKDASGTTKTFTRNTSDSSSIKAGGILTTIKDTSGNSLQFTYNNYGRITYIKLVPYGSSTITYFKITHNSYGQVNRILNETTQDAVIFYYSSAYNGTSISPYNGGYLRKIVYAHQEGSTLLDNWANYMQNGSNAYITADGIATYEYDSTGKLSSARDERSDYQVEYTYTNNKVTSITEKAGNKTSLSSGQTIGLSYHTGYTEVRTAGSDDIYGNTDDIITRYTFDNQGRTTSAYSTDSTYSIIYGATSGDYHKGDSSKNSIQTSSYVSDSAANYLLNGGFETSTGLSYWYTSGTVSRSSAAKVTGKYGAELRGTSTSTGKLYQYVALSEGKHTLSLSINTNNCLGASVKLIAKSMTNSSHEYTEVIPVDEVSASGDYSFASLSFDVAAGGEVFQIIIQITGNSSTAQYIKIDNVMLAKSVGVSSYSMLNLGGFENSAVNSSGSVIYTPSTFWTFSDSSNVSVVSANAPFNRALKITGNLTSARNAKQTVYTGTSSADKSEPKIYKIAGFGKGTGQMYNTSSRFALKVDVKYYSNTVSGEDTKTYWFDFETSLTDWQFVSGSFDVCADGGVVERIDVSCVYDYQKGTAYFDNITLVEVRDGSAESYTYYDNGMPKTYNSGDYKEWYFYTDNNTSEKISRKVTSTGGVTEYAYDSKGRVINDVYYEYTGNFDGTMSSVTLIPKVKTTYTFNSYGLITKTEMRTVRYSGTTLIDTSPANVIATTKSYNTTSGSQTFGVLTSETDALGRTTRYFYDQKGKLSATINPDNSTGMVYTTDAIGNVIKVEPASFNGSTSSAVKNAEFVEYEYTNGTLSKIITDSTAYTLNYNVFGESTGVKIGNQTIVSYTYQPNNGKLSTITYGNGTVVQNIYDELDRLSEVWYNKSGETSYKAYEYEYDANGNLNRFVDLLENKQYLYKYDDQARMVGFVESSNSVNLASSTVTYDEQSRIHLLSFRKDYSTFSSAANLKLTYQYNYNDRNELSKTSLETGHSSFVFTPSYDALNRVSSVSTKVTSGSNTITATTAYSYTSNGTNRSMQVSQVISTVGSNSTTYNYTYDNNGNITQITNAGGVIQNKYYYDDIGRLVREDNKAANKTYTWTYDNAGNILTKKTYIFTTGTLGSVQSTVTYEYNDTTWGDKLTSYNGTTITYDAIGNPLSYYNGQSYSFGWNGRQMTSATKGSTSLTYAYNDSGLRIRKTVNGVDHLYTYNGSQLMTEEWGDNLVVYLYDDSGAPVGMQYRQSTGSSGTFYTYFFETNYQGDIVAVYNESGKKVYAYQHDAWGKCTATPVSSIGPDIYAQYNPFKYRGYYQDSETGFYYLQTRYYDATLGRFINADGVGALGASSDFTGYNLYAYCGNNPVMGVDHEGTWSWKTFAKGASIALVGITAIATVLTAGCAAPALAAAVAVTSGVACIGFGAAEMVEAATDYNVIRDGLMQGNEKLYNTVRTVAEVTATISTIAVNAGAAANKAKNPLSQCFVEGTPVLAACGLIPVEQIQVGDFVWASDPETGETELKQVLQTFENQTSELVHLNYGDEEITTTPFHPFYVPQKGWTSAVDLRAGDILVTVNGEYVVLEKVQHEILENPVTVYNFEVEDFHTYYVGDTSVLVHNKCGTQHGNSLKTSKPAEGYVLKENGTGRVLKFGETTMGPKRYTKSYLSKNNTYIDFVKKGTKAEMHTWQHEMITNYFNRHGVLPPLNKSFW